MHCPSNATSDDLNLRSLTLNLDSRRSETSRFGLAKVWRDLDDSHQSLMSLADLFLRPLDSQSGPAMIGRSADKPRLAPTRLIVPRLAPTSHAGVYPGPTSRIGVHLGSRRSLHVSPSACLYLPYASLSVQSDITSLWTPIYVSTICPAQRF